MKVLVGIKGVISAVLTTLVYWVGGWDVALESLLIMILLDYLTGMGKSYVSGTLNSNRGLKGIVKKLGLLVLVAVAQIVDIMLNMAGVVRTFIIYYIVANEGLSILENLGKMDIIVPKFLVDKLEQLKEGEKENAEVGSGSE